MKRIYMCITALVLLYACNKKDNYKTIFNNPELYSKTVHELNTVVMGNNFSPIVGSRNYLYANIAAYEVIAAGYPAKYTSLAGQVNGLMPVAIPQRDNKIN